MLSFSKTKTYNIIDESNLFTKLSSIQECYLPFNRQKIILLIFQDYNQIKQMIGSIQQYDDIQKIQSFIITISSKPKNIKQAKLQQNQQKGLKNVLEDLQKGDQSHPNNAKLYQSSFKHNQASIADLTLKKIQYRTRLHENVQRYAQAKQKCELLINQSPYKAKIRSSGCLRNRNSNNKSQVKMLSYYKAKGNQALNVKVTEKVSPASLKQENKLPHLTLNPYVITISNLQKFLLFKTIKQKQTYSIYLAQSQKNRTLYTLKIYRKSTMSSIEIQKLCKELKIQYFANHLNIIKIIHITSDNHFVYVFYEAVIMLSLAQQIKQNGPFQERQVRRIIKQVCLAVQHLQKYNIFHRNICPQSIYCQDGFVKLGEFHKSDYLSTKKLSSKSKSQGCLKQRLGRLNNQDEKIDIWNIGILTYELLFGCSPIQLNLHLKQNKKNRQTLYFSQEIDVSNTAKQFIGACLEKNIQKRLGIKEVIEHGFLRGGEKYRWTTI